MGEYVIKQRVENGKSRELGRPVSAFSTAFSTGFSFCPMSCSISHGACCPGSELGPRRAHIGWSRGSVLLPLGDKTITGACHRHQSSMFLLLLNRRG